MHACELVPSIAGDFLLRVLVNGQDASYGAWAENSNIYSLISQSYTQGPTVITMDIGDINASTSTMAGPGLELAGNVVGTASSILVQLKDRYGNNRASPECRVPQTNTSYIYIVIHKYIHTYINIE